MNINSNLIEKKKVFFYKSCNLNHGLLYVIKNLGVFVLQNGFFFTFYLLKKRNVVLVALF